MRACKQKIECDICVTSHCGVDLIVHCFWDPVSVVLFPSLNSFAELGLRGLHSVSNLILLLREGWGDNEMLLVLESTWGDSIIRGRFKICARD